MIEIISEFYRNMLPIIPWLHFLAGGTSFDSSIIDISLTGTKFGIYATYKLPQLFGMGMRSFTLLKSLLKETVSGRLNL